MTLEYLTELQTSDVNEFARVSYKYADTLVNVRYFEMICRNFPMVAAYVIGVITERNLFLQKKQKYLPIKLRRLKNNHNNNLSHTLPSSQILVFKFYCATLIVGG
jgi:hypothetical protein